MNIEWSNQLESSTPIDWLIVGVWEDREPSLPTGVGTPAVIDRLKRWKEAGDFEGKQNELMPVVDSLDTAARRVLFVGIGKSEKSAAHKIAQAMGAALRFIAKKKPTTVAATLLGEGGPLDREVLAAAMVQGAIIATGSQDLYRTQKNRKPPERLIILADDMSVAGDRAQVIGESVRWAAELVNRVPAELYPESFVELLKQRAEGLPVEIEVFDVPRLNKERMGCILGVGQGSTREPRLAIIRYRGAPNESATLGLVGKGITFDSGGLSIKTADGMTAMKCDMAGAAAVVAATLAIAKLGLPLNVVALTPLAENMLGGNAIKPGDVLTARNGKTIEVLNTDAEGRLVLADALSYAVELGATRIVDLATLTGACMVALGTGVAGIMANDDPWSERVRSSARAVGERVWPLPMDEEYDELIKSQVADMKNTGGRYGGAISAAKLLEQFVASTPWVHVDLAGPAFAEKETPYQDAGGTGFFVKSLIALAEDLANNPMPTKSGAKSP